MATREEQKQKIFNFLMRKGADKFWINLALKHIMLSFAGNQHWLTEIRNFKTVIGQHGMVDKFVMRCTINTVDGHTAGRFIYTHTDKHRVRINAIK